MMMYTALTTELGVAIKRANSLDRGAIAMVNRPRYIPTFRAAIPVKLMYTAVEDHGAETGRVPRMPVSRVVTP